MKELCIVPAYCRPEFLYLCLKRIAACDNVDGLKVVVAMDHHANKMNLDRSDERQVARLQEFENLNITLKECVPHGFNGLSYNLLTLYRQALADGFERIYLIEEDVMVSPDFFEWQRRVLDSWGFFCAIGSGYPASARATQRPVNEEIYASSHYASIGVGWNKGNLIKVVEHARPEYFRDMAGYCVRTFPENKDRCYVEQAGMIGRVVVHEKAECAWAVKPKAFHIGYFGSHRGWKRNLAGTWRERAAQIAAGWHNRDALRALGEYHLDSVEAVSN